MNKYFSLDPNLEERRNSLDLPSHGRVPRWLEDMSSEVEKSHSLIIETKFLQSNSSNEQLKSAYSARNSADSTPTTSARHGRRSANMQKHKSSLQKQYISAEMDSYIVPKLDEISLFKSQGFKPVFRTLDKEFKTETLTQSISLSSAATNSYNPSILDQSSGRRSRLDQSTSKDFISERKSPEEVCTDELTISKPTEQSESKPNYFIKEEKLNFDDEYQVFKSKFQKYKRSKHNKRGKYKQIQSAKETTTNYELSKTIKADTNELGKQSDEVFIIPELPKGYILIVDILNTWGDRYYVGLNGIELFDSDGNLVKVNKITANPQDINILPECSGDPRVVTNLLDGVNRTQDDNHLWLTPYENGEHHLIKIEFSKLTELAMLRIWNYNKSRIHSYRGARDVIITLDGICIFRGEIAQASGSILGGIESFGDTILFTTEERILEKIAKNDIAFSTLIYVPDKEPSVARPSTATGKDEAIERPYTHALSQKPDSESNDQLFGVQRLDIILISNWGKMDYIGLTGLEVIGDSDISITIPKDNLRSNHLTTNAMLHRLIDDENITTERKHMWYTQHKPGAEIKISVTFEQFTYIAGIRVWNYNENLEMTFCGVRTLKILLDNKPMINSLTNDLQFYLRRAPGNTHYDYVQEIRFNHSNSPDLHQDPFYDFNSLPMVKDEAYDNPIMPEGFVFEIVIYTTWGDHYYVGLNGIEVFDQNGKQIVLTETNICAHPESVNVLPGVSGDIRTPDKLVDGINDRSDGTHAWLVPVIPKCLNRIYIVFDQPVTISVIKIWNYLKAPSRGVKEFGILVDDLLIYNGILDKISDKSSVKYRTILFTNNKNVLQKEMASLVKHSIDSQATILTNNEPRMTTGGSLPNADQSLRPFTSVNHLNRGRTSQSN